MLDTIVFKLLLATCRHRGKPYVRPWWERLYSRFITRHRVVETVVHGRRTLINFGHHYPITARVVPTYNAPLLELVNETYKSKNRPIRLVDIGAGVGDTALLVEANCPGMISEFVCIDGDPEFSGYLESNLSSLGKARVFSVQLSRAESYSPALVHTHPGTACATGASRVMTASLDQVLQSNAVGAVDVLKIDVDGFDGEVLAGAGEVIEEDRPGVVFEWHPICCLQTNNSWHEAFKSLEAADYRRFIWFNKYGEFSHFMFGYDRDAIDAMAEFCLADVPADWHYDVIALHESNAIDIQSLGKLSFSKRRPSQF